MPCLPQVGMGRGGRRGGGGRGGEKKYQSVGRRSNVGMARMKYDVIGLQKPSKPGERA